MLPILNRYFTELNEALKLNLSSFISFSFCPFLNLSFIIYLWNLSLVTTICVIKRYIVFSYNYRSFSKYTRAINIQSSYKIMNNEEIKNTILIFSKFVIEKLFIQTKSFFLVNNKFLCMIYINIFVYFVIIKKCKKVHLR